MTVTPKQLDVDALISGSNDLVVEAREYIDVLTIANRKPGPSSVDIMSRQADALEALIAEVRRLREEVLVHRYILESGRWYFTGKASGEVGEWWLRQINRSFADPKEGDVEKARDWFESKGDAA